MPHSPFAIHGLVRLGVLCVPSVWWVWVKFFVGGPVPPRPPKCALKGAFHEAVRLGVFVFGLASGWVWVKFFVGGPVPPRPPKCALKGAFHEAVRLGVLCLAWPFGGLG